MSHLIKGVKINQRGELRTGFTTGACAAAAAKAATRALLLQRSVSEVEITLPNGESADFIINECLYNTEESTCSVIKDAGDDAEDGARIKSFTRKT